MPAPHHSVFYRPDALSDAQPKHQSKINQAYMEEGLLITSMTPNM